MNYDSGVDYNLCRIDKDTYPDYFNTNCKTQFLVVCSKMLMFIFNGSFVFPNLRGIIVSKFCTCRLSLIDHIISHKQFPRLCGIKKETPTEGQYENFVKGHTMEEMYPATSLYYFCERNKEKIHCAMLLFYVMRKQYPLIDRNVAKRICREYIELDYNLPCQEEIVLYKNWQPETLVKKRKVLEEKKAKKEDEIESLRVIKNQFKEQLSKIDSKLTEKWVKRNQRTTKLEILDKMLKFSLNIEKELK